MLELSEFSHNHHPSGVKMDEKYIRRGISGIFSRSVMNRDNEVKYGCQSEPNQSVKK